MKREVLDAWIEGYLSYLSDVRRMNARTISDVRCSLKKVSAFMSTHKPERPLWKVSLDDYLAWLEHERDKGSSANVMAKQISHIRGLLDYSWRSGRADRNVLDGFSLQDALRKSAPRALSLEEAERLVYACASRSAQQRRGRVVILLLYGCGLRTSELCGLDLQDIDIERREVFVRHGKGNRQRTIPVPGAVWRTKSVYDELDRLIVQLTFVPGRLTPFIAQNNIDNAGNIQSRVNGLTESALEYQYNDSAHPHAVTSLIGNAGEKTDYTYDARGNVNTRAGHLVPGGLQTFTHTAFNLPRTIDYTSEGAAKQVRYEYDAFQQRLVEAAEGAKQSSTLLAGDLYERTTGPSSEFAGASIVTEHRYRIYGGTGEVANFTRVEQDNTLLEETLRYLHTDALGSPFATSNDSGEASDIKLPDTWGQNASPPGIVAGFTGHRSDKELGLINMRGRIYDPASARFLQTDPILARPYDSQGHNAYAYVRNNPLRLIDPTGLDFSCTQSSDASDSTVYDCSGGGGGGGGGFNPNPNITPPSFTPNITPPAAPTWSSEAQQNDMAPNQQGSLWDRIAGAANDLKWQIDKKIIYGDYFGSDLLQTAEGIKTLEDTADTLMTVSDVAAVASGAGLLKTAVVRAPGLIRAIPGAVRSVRGAIPSLPGNAKSIGRFFSDSRRFSTIRAQYSRATGGLRPRGMSLHHWFFPQRLSITRGGPIPDRIVNAGWNLFEISGRTNSLMSPAIKMGGLRGAYYASLEWGIRAGVPSSIVGSAYAGGTVGEYAAEHW